MNYVFGILMSEVINWYINESNMKGSFRGERGS